jgi:valyl-tRNA synthetase
MQGGESEAEIDPTLLSSDDIWILLRLDSAIREVSSALDNYHFNEAAHVLYRFFWNEYCDWYIEASKAVLQGNDAARKANTLAVIDFVLSHTLRLFHPFLPFITEELWQGMGFNAEMPESQGGKTIMFAPWPKPLDNDFKEHYRLLPEKAAFTESKYELVRLGRNLKREANIAVAKKVQYVLKPEGEIPAEEIAVIKLLLNAQEISVDPTYQPPKGTPSARTPLGDLYLPLAGAVDIDAEKVRLQKELEKIQREIDKIQEKLNNPQFTQKVPPPILAEQQRRLAEWEIKKQKAWDALQALVG